jgi:hypothetical protein
MNDNQTERNSFSREAVELFFSENAIFKLMPIEESDKDDLIEERLNRIYNKLDELNLRAEFDELERIAHKTFFIELAVFEGKSYAEIMAEHTVRKKVMKDFISSYLFGDNDNGDSSANE